VTGVDYREGDYREVADRLRPAAEQLVTWCAPVPYSLVVDVAAGTGNVSKLCTAYGAEAVAVDVVVEQLALGREVGDSISWVAGDATALPLRDGVAAAALSTFGVIYAARPDDAVRELARVVVPNGRIGLTAWPEGGYQQAASDLLRSGADGPDHIAVWGTAARITEHLGAVADEIEVRTGELTATFASVDAWWESRSTTTPSIVSARRGLDDDAFDELGRRYRELAREFGTTTDDRFVLSDSYLVALARVR
jgi:SAM-dependent methyltransferase